MQWLLNKTISQHRKVTSKFWHKFERGLWFLQCIRTNFILFQTRIRIDGIRFQAISLVKHLWTCSSPWNWRKNEIINRSWKWSKIPCTALYTIKFDKICNAKNNPHISFFQNCTISMTKMYQEIDDILKEADLTDEQKAS